MKLPSIILALIISLFGCGGASANFTLTTASSGYSLQSSVTYVAPSGSGNNITFTFDQPYPVGQYTNGDYWVAPNTAGGTVTISSISPAQAVRSGTSTVMNGAVANITDLTHQGFDGWQGNGYSGMYSSGMTIALPLAVNTTTTPITSVIKSVSKSTTPAGFNDTIIQFAAVLTVESSAADRTGSFRPSYIGTSGKFQINVSSINPAILGQVNMSGITAITSYPFSQVVSDYAGLQMDYISGTYKNEYLHVYDNSYLNTGYGSEAALEYVKPLLRFAANDFSYTNTTDKQALINYLQRVIDLAGAVQAGTSFNEGGGGYGYNRLLPLAFAGNVLGNSTITGLTTSGTFGENLGFHLSGATGMVLHGNYFSYAAPWTYPDIFFEEQAIATGPKDVMDPEGWTDSGSASNAGGYLACCVIAPARYEAIAASMYGFGSTHPFDYMLHISNRIQDHGLQFAPDPFAPYPYVEGSGNLTGKDSTWGLNAATGHFFTGAGRTPTADGHTLTITHTDAMGEAIWSNWITTHDYQAPSVVSTLSATPGTTQIALTWTASTGTPDHYDVYRATNSDYSNSTFLHTVSTPGYTDTGLTTGNSYRYWVVAVDAAGNVSSMSNAATATSL